MCFYHCWQFVKLRGRKVFSLICEDILRRYLRIRQLFATNLDADQTPVSLICDGSSQQDGGTANVRRDLDHWPKGAHCNPAYRGQRLDGSIEIGATRAASRSSSYVIASQNSANRLPVFMVRRLHRGRHYKTPV